MGEPSFPVGGPPRHHLIFIGSSFLLHSKFCVSLSPHCISLFIIWENKTQTLKPFKIHFQLKYFWGSLIHLLARLHNALMPWSKCWREVCKDSEDESGAREVSVRSGLIMMIKELCLKRRGRVNKKGEQMREICRSERVKCRWRERQIGMCPSSEYCWLKPSGLCFASAWLKRHFAVHVVFLTDPVHTFEYNSTEPLSKHNNHWPLLAQSLSLSAEFHVCLLTWGLQWDHSLELLWAVCECVCLHIRAFSVSPGSCAEMSYLWCKGPHFFSGFPFSVYLQEQKTFRVGSLLS